jgi:hypothetical protein
MLAYMHAAGLHFEQANARCAKHPAPWPAWSDSRDTQNQLTEMADKFQNGRMNRMRLAVALAGLYQSLATQLAFPIPPRLLDSDATCMEIYMRLAVALGFAQTTTQIFQRLTPDAAVRLRQAISLIYQMRHMPQPCRDFNGPIPAVGEALNSPNDSSVVGRVDDIWRAGEIAAGPQTE